MEAGRASIAVSLLAIGATAHGAKALATRLCGIGYRVTSGGSFRRMCNFVASVKMHTSAAAIAERCHGSRRHRGNRPMDGPAAGSRKEEARKLVQESPAVADAFLRMLGDTGERRIWVMLCPDQHNRRKREAVKALADRDAAVAEMKTPRIKQQDLENIGTRSRGHSQPQSWALAIVRTRSRWHRSRWHRSRGHPHYARGRGR